MFKKIQNPIKSQFGYRFVWKSLRIRGCFISVPNFNFIFQGVYKFYTILGKLWLSNRLGPQSIASTLKNLILHPNCRRLESLENRVCRTVPNMATGERVCVNSYEQLWCVTVFAFWHSKLISPLFIVFERNTEEIVKK